MPKKQNHNEEMKNSETMTSTTNNGEIHTKAYNESVEKGEAPATEPEGSFWQSAKFQWIIFGIGIIVVLGIMAWQWLTTIPMAVNPTNAPITFQIDGKSFEVPARGKAEVKISHGEHTLTMDGQEKGKFNYGWFDGEAIINPTMQSFVEEHVIYVVPGKKPEQFADKVPNNVIEIDGEKYEGPFRLIEPALYLPKTWDYAPWEGSVNTLHTKDRSDYAIRKELHYIDAFKAMFQ